MNVARRLRLRPGDLTSLLLVGLTAGVGLAAVPCLPAEMTVGWQYGLDGGLRVTHAPRLFGVALLPALAAGFCLALRAGARTVSDTSEALGRPVLYETLAHLLLGVFCVAQASLVWLNL